MGGRGSASPGSGSRFRLKNALERAEKGESFCISSRQQANRLGHAWVGAGARPIFDRVTGKHIGYISVDGKRVYRFIHQDVGTPERHINLVDRVAGTNSHVCVKGP